MLGVLEIIYELSSDFKRKHGLDFVCWHLTMDIPCITECLRGASVGFVGQNKDPEQVSKQVSKQQMMGRSSTAWSHVNHHLRYA